jgi:hypothetical protein
MPIIPLTMVPSLGFEVKRGTSIKIVKLQRVKMDHIDKL